MKRVNMVVVGCGNIATTVHIPNILSIAEARLVGLCDVDSNRLHEIGDKFNVTPEHRHSTIEQALTREDVDAIIICTPPPTHAALAIVAAEAGKHVFVEKPMAETSADADRMISKAEEHGIKLYVGHFMSFLPNHQKVRQLMRNGAIGRVFYAEVHSETLVIEPKVGALLDYACHSIDLLRWYFDDTSVERVAALLQDVEGGAADSSANLLLQFANGVVGRIGAYWVPQYKNWDAVTREVRILGIKGKLITEFTTPPITIYRGGTLVGRVRGPYKIVPRFVMHPKMPLSQTSYRKEIEDFANCIRHNTTPKIGGKEGKSVLKIIEAARRSFEEKTFAEVEW